MVSTDFLGSFTPVSWVQIGVRVPLTYVEGDGITEEGLPDFMNPVDGFALGDIELEGKFRLYGDVSSPLVLGASGFVGFPTGAATGGDNLYVGDNVFSGGIRGILDAKIVEELRAALNLTYFIRGDGRVGSTDLGMDFRYSGALSYQITPIFSVMGDIWGSTRFDAANGSNTLEASGGVEFTPLNSGVYIRGAFGGGILQGIGTPDFRGMLGVMYVHESMDEDGDGIKDDLDQCPTIAEDADDYQDDDGCPETDNDEDGIADTDDKCPDRPEDLDKFEDNDGCPEADNDKDGIPDLADRCPNEPENKNGWEDEDGCPDVPDRDSDGVTDDKDKCPDAPEDTDGYADTDGCPDPDNDLDGIPDDEDECVDEPETHNDFEDRDGCPDENPDGTPPRPPPGAAAPPTPAAAPKP